MNLLRDLPARDASGNVRVVVETPAGSRVKYKYDERLGVFSWSRTLVRGVRFPYDFGFVPRTLADDGDALDALILADETTHPGIVVPTRVVGALRIEQQRDGGPVKRNDRLIAVPAFDSAHGITDIADVKQRVRDELEQFTHAALVLTGKLIVLRGWADAAEAATVLRDAEARFPPP